MKKGWMCICCKITAIKTHKRNRKYCNNCRVYVYDKIERERQKYYRLKRKYEKLKEKCRK